MKYKVGDKVRIKDGLKPDEYGVTPSMLGYCGEVMTIKSTYSMLSAYYLVEDNCEFIWHEDTLEPVAIRSVLFPNVEYVFNEKQAEEYVERLNKELANHFNAFPNDGISAKNGGKNSMKFTFYFNVNEGARVDKSCNGTIPIMTTNIELLGGNVSDRVISIEGSATCDKADYDMRQGVLEALANAVFDGNFEKAYNKAAKANALCERQDRTCYYCGKIFDTVEEKQEHEEWHVERRKARRERYLLRKRAKEIAFEEQAQKMAKEIITENKKEAK